MLEDRGSGFYPHGFKMDEEMVRPDVKKLLAQAQQAKWSREQDIYLIEHNHLPLAELMQQLCFNEEEINARRKVLGLTTRLKQMRKLSH